MTERLSPERAVRLLRAKAGELEAKVLSDHKAGDPFVTQLTYLTADIALVAGLLADFIEHTDPTVRLYEAHTENLIERMARVDRHLWPDEWKAEVQAEMLAEYEKPPWGPDSPGYDEMGQ